MVKIALILAALAAVFVPAFANKSKGDCFSKPFEHDLTARDVVHSGECDKIDAAISAVMASTYAMLTFASSLEGVDQGAQRLMRTLKAHNNGVSHPFPASW